MVETSPSSTINNNLIYSRSKLLALYSSPLIPNVLPGMKPLSEWYGEFDTPASPQNNGRRGQDHNNNQQSNNVATNSPSTRERSERPERPERSERSNNSVAGMTGVGGTRPNPFANFGRFGVDGGLLEGNDSMSNERSTGGKGLTTEKRRDREPAPHLNGTSESRSIGGKNIRGTGGVGVANNNNHHQDKEGSSNGNNKFSSSPPSNNFFGDKDRSNNNRNTTRNGINGEVGVANVRDRERREENIKKEGRAEEGGWRSVGGSDRERRLRAANNSSSNNNNPTSSYDRDSRTNHSSNNNNYSSSRDNNNNERSERGTPRSGKPAWMDEDSNSKDSAPAWMDAPASGAGGGQGLTFGSTTGSGSLDGSGGGGGGGDGLDGIQAFKAQMKEMERREKEAASGGFNRKEEATPLVSSKATSVSQPQEATLTSDLNDVFIPPPSNKDSRSSVFDNLGLGTGISATSTQSSVVQQAAGSARGSRFAKFFDGKPPVAQQTSAFEGLLGGNTGGEAPSQEGRDSMARLMGMLQVSGARTTASPPVTQPTSVASSMILPPSAPSPTTSAPVIAESQPQQPQRQASGGSRFAFSQPLATSPPAQAHIALLPQPSAQYPQPQAQQQSQALQSPPLQQPQALQAPHIQQSQPLQLPYTQQTQQQHNQQRQQQQGFQPVDPRTFLSGGSNNSLPPPPPPPPASGSSLPPLSNQRPLQMNYSPYQQQQGVPMPQQQQFVNQMSNGLRSQQQVGMPYSQQQQQQQLPPSQLLQQQYSGNNGINRQQVPPPPPLSAPSNYSNYPPPQSQQFNGPLPPRQVSGNGLPPPPPNGYGPPPPQFYAQQQGNYRGPPPPPPPQMMPGMMGMYGAGGPVPDLMALLNSGNSRGGPPQNMRGGQQQQQYMMEQ